MAEFKEGGEPPPSEDLLRKLSKTVLRAARRRERIEADYGSGKPRRETRLFEVLTARNADRIAELMQHKPVFYQNREEAPRKMLLHPSIQDLIPPEFLKNPTAWIEAQPNIERGYEEWLSGTTIAELEEDPYDVSKVKRFNLKGGGKQVEVIVVSKRVEPKQLEEISLAVRAYESGIPTPAVLGEITDRGNTYVWFENISGINLHAALDKMDKAGKDSRDSIAVESEDEEDFVYRMRVELPGIEANSEIYAQLHAIWAKEAERMKVRRAAFRLADTVNHPENLNDLSSEIPANTFMQALEILGFKDTKGFYDFAVEVNLDSKSVSRAWLSLDEKVREYNRDGFRAAESSWRSALAEACFGFDVYAETKRLEELCISKGIKHKDFDERNLVIPWDFERDQPLPQQPGKPLLYVVDREQEPVK